MREEIKRDYDKVLVILAYLTAQLQTVRDIKANSKSTVKERLSKLEKHLALSVQLSKDLLERYNKK